jgi:hypothetical protein
VNISTAATIAAPPEQVFTFLRSLDRHWGLIGGRAEPLRADSDGAGYLLRLRGPLGIRRTVQTHITTLQEPVLLVGRIEAGRRTRATLSWAVRGRGQSSRVVLAAQIDSIGPIDRALLYVGGHWWVRRTLRVALRGLAEEMGGRGRVAAHSPEPVESGRPWS